MGDSFSNREQEAPFNMAIATLKRLDLILIQIRQLHLIHDPDSISKQKAHIELVKQFYLNAVPLFDPATEIKAKKDKEKKDKESKEKKGDDKKLKTMKELGEEILSFKMSRKSFIRNANQSVHEIYSYEKEIRLNEILCELQTKLKKFFMPGKRAAEGLM